MTTCRHDPSGYGVNPDTGDVWCFRCKPPRCISDLPRKATMTDTAAEFAAAVTDLAQARIKALEAENEQLRGQVAVLRKACYDAALELYVLCDVHTQDTLQILRGALKATADEATDV